MFDPVARSKRMVKQVVLRQALAVIAVAALSALLAPSGARFAAGVCAGGFAVVLGNVVASRIALPAGMLSAGAVAVRWFLALAVRWLVFGGVLLGAILVWKLPPLALLSGVVVALSAYLVIVSMQTVRNPT